MLSSSAEAQRSGGERGRVVVFQAECVAFMAQYRTWSQSRMYSDPMNILTFSLSLLVLTVFLSSSANVDAAVLRVGPQHELKRPSDAARRARSGDTVLIEAGQYSGDAAVWTQAMLKIRAIGGVVVLRASGASAEGKAIWVFRGGHFEVEGIHFEGSRVADRNGAGIRFESGRLKINRCVFRDNENGVLTSNDASAVLLVENSIFFDAPKDRSAFRHLLYVGKIEEFSLTGSRLHGGFHGHLVKSRAARSRLHHNFIVDGAGGRASYEAEFPNGGDVELVGNVLSQSATTENPVLLSYGAEGRVWRHNRLRLVHNTFHSAAWRAIHVHVANGNRFAAEMDFEKTNNLFVLPGWSTVASPRKSRGNAWIPSSMLGDPDTLDFGVAGDSWLRGRVVEPEGAFRRIGGFEFSFPAGVRHLEEALPRVPGAIQTPSITH